MGYGGVGVTGADDGFAVTPSDSTVFATMPRALYVGVAGTVVLRTALGTSLTFTCVAGAVIPCRCDKVLAASTATGIIGLY